MHLDQYVVLHAALVSALHKLVGIEFGTHSPSVPFASLLLTNSMSHLAAFFVQRVVTCYDGHFADLSNPAKIKDVVTPRNEGEPLGKECSNLAVLLSELYNFQVISSVLMYDVIRALLDGDLSEFKVELLLKVARSAWFHVDAISSDLHF